MGRRRPPSCSGSRSSVCVMLASMVPLVDRPGRRARRSAPELLERASVYTRAMVRHRAARATRSENGSGGAQDDVGPARRPPRLRSARSSSPCVFQVLTIGLFTFYFVADGPRFRRAVCSVLTPRRQREVLAAWDIAIEKTGGYLYSRLLLAVVNAAATFVRPHGARVCRSRSRSRCGKGSCRSSSRSSARTSPPRSRCIVALLEDPWSAAGLPGLRRSCTSRSRTTCSRRGSRRGRCSCIRRSRSAPRSPEGRSAACSARSWRCRPPR